MILVVVPRALLDLRYLINANLSNHVLASKFMVQCQMGIM